MGEQASQGVPPYNSGNYLAKGVADEPGTTGRRRPGPTFTQSLPARSVAVSGSDESGHGSQDRTQVSRLRTTAQRGRGAAHLEDPPRSPGGRLACPGATASGRAEVTSQDPAGVAPARASRRQLAAVPADPGASGQAVAGPARARPGSILRPGA